MKSRGLVWDIENSSFKVDTWGTYAADAIYIREYPKILTVAWHWIGDNRRNGQPKVYSIGQDDFKGYKRGVNDDTEIVKFLWELLNEADYTVAHNGDNHDSKIAHARMVIHKLPPPSPYKQVDTKKMAKRIGKFGSNTLKNLALQMGHSQKGDPGGYDTWLGCEQGDPKAWKRMKKYNEMDIPPLLDLYLTLRPWDKQAVPLNVLENRLEQCPKCAEGKMYAGMKYASNKTGTQYQYFRCNRCGGMAKRRIPEDSYRKADYVS